MVERMWPSWPEREKPPWDDESNGATIEEAAEKERRRIEKEWNDKAVAHHTDRDTDALLTERGKTHGDYTDNAFYSQEFKGVAKIMRNWAGMAPWARESVDMILHKIARAGAGAWDEPDHWDDIAGYARLTAERCRERRGKK